MIIVAEGHDSMPTISIATNSPANTVPSSTSSMREKYGMNTAPLTAPTTVTETMSIRHAAHSDGVRMPIMSSFCMRHTETPANTRNALERTLDAIQYRTIVTIRARAAAIDITKLDCEASKRTSSRNESTPHATITPLRTVQSRSALSDWLPCSR